MPPTAFTVAQEPQEAVQPIARDRGQQEMLRGASAGSVGVHHCARPALRWHVPCHDPD